MNCGKRSWLVSKKHAQKTTSAYQNLLRVLPTIHLAQKMGESLGRCKVL
jgi:hypothetical protein